MEQLGITERKSLTAIVPKECQNSIDFWRGVIDGDGSLYFIKRKNIPRVSLVGSKDVCNAFKLFIKDNLNVETYVNKHKNIFSICLNGHSIKFSNFLYKNSCIFLDRKYQKYIEFLEKEKNENISNIRSSFVSS